MTLSIADVTKRYKIRVTGAQVNALNGVTINLPEKQTLGIVGESGCGKSTLARMIVGLEQPTTGSVTWNGAPIFDKAKNMLSSKHSKIQLVFQDPYSSLNPRQKVGESIAEVLKVHQLVEKNAINSRIDELLTEVGISPELAHRYPHQLSGGQRQRVSIARALASQPDLLVLDEPVSALDVSVRAEVMNLLIDLRERLGLTYIFISHDLSMIRHISDQIAVMYLGRIVETGPWNSVLENPRHPYTRALIAAMPDHTIVGNDKFEAPLTGEVPDPAQMPSGCAFHMRCPIAQPSCSQNIQILKTIEPNHTVACQEVSK
jgi:oligopeptide/dipeptide ABC transporter ATP-binding protein